VSELWSLLNFLLPDVFDDLESFQNWFDFSSVSKDTEKDIVKKEKENLVLKLHEILRPFLLRRLKSDVDCEVPEKKEFILYVPMVAIQQDYYDAIKNKDLNPIFDKYVTKEEEKKEIKSKNLLNVLMQLRKVCNHPLLLQPFDYDEKKTIEENDELYSQQIVNNSGKFTMLEKILPMLFKNGHRVLIFSLFTSMLDILESYMQIKKYQFCRLDGNVKQTDREERIQEFQKKDSKIFCFLVSTRAGGLGINLTGADTVIIYDSDWNPQIDLQAQDRCHRIGQKKKVRVVRLITTKSIEKKVLLAASKKLNLERMIIAKGNFKGSDQKSLSTENLIEILTKTQKESEFESEIISDKNLEKMLLQRDEELKNGPGFEEMKLSDEHFVLN
jgi:ATP-dependent DNA helicase